MCCLKSPSLWGLIPAAPGNSQSVEFPEASTVLRQKRSWVAVSVAFQGQQAILRFIIKNRCISFSSLFLAQKLELPKL